MWWSPASLQRQVYKMLNDNGVVTALSTAAAVPAPPVRDAGTLRRSSRRRVAGSGPPARSGRRRKVLPRRAPLPIRAPRRDEHRSDPRSATLSRLAVGRKRHNPVDSCELRANARRTTSIRDVTTAAVSSTCPQAGRPTGAVVHRGVPSIDAVRRLLPPR